MQSRVMKKRAVAILLVCVMGLAAYLVWRPTHDLNESRNAEYYFNRAWERGPADNDKPGDPEGAIADLSRAINLNPEFAAA